MGAWQGGGYRFQLKPGTELPTHGCRQQTAEGRAASLAAAAGQRSRALRRWAPAASAPLAARPSGARCPPGAAPPSDPAERRPAGPLRPGGGRGPRPPPLPLHGPPPGGGEPPPVPCPAGRAGRRHGGGAPGGPSGRCLPPHPAPPTHRGARRAVRAGAAARRRAGTAGEGEGGGKRPQGLPGKWGPEEGRGAALSLAPQGQNGAFCTFLHIPAEARPHPRLWRKAAATKWLAAPGLFPGRDPAGEGRVPGQVSNSSGRRRGTAPFR